MHGVEMAKKMRQGGKRKKVDCNNEFSKMGK